MNLPAYLQNKTRVDLNTVATAGMGGALPPHISIRGNSYTLIDANGAQQPLGPQMYACVIDILGVMGKRYYENDWTPGSDEPPTCWSTNGVGPSRESVSPQSQTCSGCQWNVRGSETSKISGKGIKACRDEKIVALLLPQYPGMLFQLVIPPGSFKNWSAFTKPFENSGMDVSDVLVSFGFQPQVNGVMTFDIAKDQQGNGVYMPEHLVPVFNKAIATKATDVLVGRNDVPIALPAPSTVALHQQLTHEVGPAPQVQQPAPFGANTAAPQNTAPQTAMQGQPGGFGAPTAAGMTAQQAGAPTTAQPEQPRPQRTRRTRDQIAADNAAKAAQAGTSAPQPHPAPVQPQAPFPVQNQSAPGFGAAPAAPQGFGGQPQNPQPAFGAAAQTANPSFAPQGQPSGQSTQQGTPTGFGQGSANTASPSNGFGIQQGADPNVDPQLASMLASIGT